VVSAKERVVSVTEGRRSREVSAKVSASRESGSTDTHFPVERAKLVAQGKEFDPKDTPLVPHAQEFVFLSTSRCTDLKSTGNRQTTSIWDRKGTQHFRTAAGGRGALAHHRQGNDENRPHHGDVIRPDVKKNFRFGPLRRGKFIFRLMKNPPYYRVDSVSLILSIHRQVGRDFC
jgi:hypothetical protein